MVCKTMCCCGTDPGLKSDLRDWRGVVSEQLELAGTGNSCQEIRDLLAGSADNQGFGWQAAGMHPGLARAFLDTIRPANHTGGA